MASRNIGWILIGLTAVVLWLAGRTEWLLIFGPVAIVAALLIGRSKRSAIPLQQDAEKR